MKYRNRTDLVAKILESASGGPISKTRLTYMTYITYEQVSRFAAMLIEKDLLTFDKQTRLFHTTAKGRKFVEIYNEMQQCAGYLDGEQMNKKKTIGKTN